MKRLALLCLLLVTLLGVHATIPEANSSWGCGPLPPQCTFGGSNAQCDPYCGVGLGVCARPGCCECIA
jgi:hypothetical protein